MQQSWLPARLTQRCSWLATATWLPSQHWCSQVTSSECACIDANVAVRIAVCDLEHIFSPSAEAVALGLAARSGHIRNYVAIAWH